MGLVSAMFGCCSLAGACSFAPFACRSSDATYTRRVDDIVERELSDEGVELEEQRKRLTDTTWGECQ